MPVPRHRLAGAAIGNRVYFLSGSVQAAGRGVRGDAHTTTSSKSVRDRRVANPIAFVDGQSTPGLHAVYRIVGLERRIPADWSGGPAFSIVKDRFRVSLPSFRGVNGSS